MTVLMTMLQADYNDNNDVDDDSGGDEGDGAALDNVIVDYDNSGNMIATVILIMIEMIKMTIMIRVIVIMMINTLFIRVYGKYTKLSILFYVI